MMLIAEKRPITIPFLLCYCYWFFFTLAVFTTEGQLRADPRDRQYKRVVYEPLVKVINGQIDRGLGMLRQRHRADVWKIERNSGYDLFEFQNARLTNVHTHRETSDKALFSYNKKNMFGAVSIDTTRNDPTVTYKIITIDNENVHSSTVQKSQLSYP